MKKIICALLLVVMVLSFAACGQTKIEGTLDELVDKIYADSGTEEEFAEFSKNEVTDENKFYCFGTNDISFKEALSSDPPFNVTPYSLVLVRINEGDNPEEIKAIIKENANPRKWVCVGVDDDQVYVETNGDLVLLLMCGDDEQSAKIIEAFLALGK